MNSQHSRAQYRTQKITMNDRTVFYNELNRLLLDPRVQSMEQYPQHHGTNTLRHSIRVAQTSFELAQHLGWDIDERELARGAMLHDYYLYDIKAERLTPYRHGISHPKIAADNAKKDFGLTDHEVGIIRSHMWPLTLFSPPRSKEAALVCMADKYIATQEMFLRNY